MAEKPDIIERLEWDRRYVAGHVRVTLSNAADEIKKLRAQVAELEERLHAEVVNRQLPD